MTAAWALEDALLKAPSVLFDRSECDGVLPRGVVSMRLWALSTLSPQQVPLAEPAGERTIITLIVLFERGGYRAVSRTKDQFRAS